MLATLTALMLVALADAPATIKPPPAELAAITERGRNLAGYDAACWHASDAVQAEKPKAGSVTRYIARKGDKGWVVAFGTLDEAKEHFLIAYEATQGKNADRFEVKAFDPPKQDASFFRSGARAIEVALKDFVSQPNLEQRPYNVAVLPAPKEEIWVYLVPAPTKAGVWPLGGDVRYLVSADGTKLLDRRRLHKSVIEVERPQEAGQDQEQVAGIHTHVLAEIPEDTDVFHVLIRKPRVPELIRTAHWIFVVEPDGTIKPPTKPDETLKTK